MLQGSLLKRGIDVRNTRWKVCFVKIGKTDKSLNGWLEVCTRIVK